MRGGVAAALRKHGGKEIEEEALESAPLELGQAIATSAGKLDAKFVVHAAAMELGKGANAESIRVSFKNSLELADSLECESMAVPAIGCGIGGFNLEQASEILLREASSFSASCVKTVFFVLHSPDAQGVFLRKAKELGISLTDFSAFKKRAEEEKRKRELEREKEEESEPKTSGTAGDFGEAKEESESAS
jgi:O-acetyl-ADP-ribose deacetylase (regulator of RNase III)